MEVSIKLHMDKEREKDSPSSTYSLVASSYNNLLVVVLKIY